ncbi:alpha/beta hydrolase [Listeria costaricensis]|uniref:alpha/beta hydrolase n=1 Tax=Listeria costaricensis TaxID=2026604 RepID=UPI000C0723CF|nr:alpha/beta hydrolase [Listeria costaricensis]
MLSKEAQEAITFSRNFIKPGQKFPLTPEIAAHARKDADEGNAVETPADIQLENIAENGVAGELYRTKEASESVLLFMHGGAYATGSVKSRQGICFKLLKRLEFDIFSVDYAQWPEARHPQAHEDVVAAYTWLEKRYQKIYVFGESAGATLALTLVLDRKAKNLALPEKVSVFSPVMSQLSILPSEFTHSERDPMLIGAGDPVPYFDEPEKRDPLISPIYGDFTGFPKLQINCGSEEVKLDHAKVLYTLCQQAGTDVSLDIWRDLFHVFILFDMPETEKALDKIADFFK